MNKIIGTKVGSVVNLLINGNAYQKTFENQESANEFFKLLILAKGGNNTAFAQVMQELKRKYKTVIKDVLEVDSSDNYFLKGYDVVMPKMLAETFLDYLENNFPVNALVNFWKLLMTNKDQRVRNDLFRFLQHYNFAITDNGYFIAYKAVEYKIKTDNDLAAFISNQYLKIKKWKKNPAHYEVVVFQHRVTEEVQNPDYDSDVLDFSGNNSEFIEVSKTVFVNKLVKVGERNPDNGEVYKVIGNLYDLFKNIDQFAENSSVYQSKTKGVNGKVEQVLGRPVKMDRVDTNNDPKEECSYGLHVGSTKYVQWYGSDPDDVILLVLVNPAHVVAVPDHDTSKMRTCEYFPYAVLDRNEDGTFEVIEEIPYFEEDYMKYEKADLEKEVANIQSEIEKISSPDQEKLDYKKILEERIVTLDGVLGVFGK